MKKVTQHEKKFHIEKRFSKICNQFTNHISRLTLTIILCVNQTLLNIGTVKSKNQEKLVNLFVKL